MKMMIIMKAMMKSKEPFLTGLKDAVPLLEEMDYTFIFVAEK
jgi:hypothetical protein